MTLHDIRRTFDCATLRDARAITQQPTFPTPYKRDSSGNDIWQMREVLAWKAVQGRLISTR